MCFNGVKNKEMSKYLVFANIVRKIRARILHSARAKPEWCMCCHSQRLFLGLGWKKWKLDAKGWGQILSKTHRGNTVH